MQPEKAGAPMNGSADHKTNGMANGNKNASSQTPRAPKNQKASDIKAKIAKELVVQTDMHTADEAEMAHLRSQFDVFDIDGNGTIEGREFVEICQKMGLEMRTTNALLEEFDDNVDGKISLEEYSRHDVVNHLMEAVRKQNFEREKTALHMEMRTHVNVGRIIDVVRAKMDNSKLAFQLMLHLAFMCIYVFVVIEQRAPRDAMAMRAALINYLATSTYRAPNSYQMKSWYDVRTHEDLWDWQQIHFTPMYHLETYYNGDDYNLGDRGTVLQHIRMCSGFRLVQRRGKNGTCDSNPSFADFADDCYADTLIEGRFGPAYDEEPFKGRKSGIMYVHTTNAWYDKGYIENFDSNYTASLEHLQRLRDDMWVDKGTRFFIIDLVAYCSNTGQFAEVQFKVDMRVTGELVPSVQVRCRRYGFYQKTLDWLRLALELVLVLAWLAYMYDMVRHIFTMAQSTGNKLAFFAVLWNLVDLAYFLLLGASIGLWLYIISDPDVRNLKVTETSITMPNGSPVNFTNTALAVEIYFAINGINMLLGLARVMRFLRFNANLGQLTDALELMMEGLAQWVLILVFVIVTFTFIGMMLFGDQQKMFSDPGMAVDAIIGFTIGASDLSDLYDVNPASFLIIYVPFVLIMLFFILPLTIAIIMDGYCEMLNKHAEAARSNMRDVFGLPVHEQAYRGLVRAMQLFVKRKEEHPRLKYPGKEEVLLMFGEYQDTPIMPYSELRKLLRDKNIPEELLMSLIEHYDGFQADPDWNHLSAVQTVEIEKQRKLTEISDNNPTSILEEIDSIEKRLLQISADQTYAHQKLDLLCEIFPAQTFT